MQVAILVVRGPDPGRDLRLAAQLRGFSPLAQVAVGALVPAGVVLAGFHLQRPSDLC